ncbi:hypothetical protein PV05_00404 [Exophiala xenobiotica]|uniref:DNA polymerase delta subunit 4 n=1 Tax=Exophiala xenobiotica TaxID=348802 RepID=A0A0D2EZQ6_9EURO|nr:uncharacterized protein PV05_00404 [Exophiala xenobiotica]KIW60165.1 hypothetical protein PV05_00404 [Exophiala xenobiotica]
MPRGRKAKGAAASNAQSRLSFNNSARVTKPGTRQDDAVKKAASKLSEPAQAQVEDEVRAIETPETEDEPEANEVQVTPEPESKKVDVPIRESPLKPKTTTPKTKKKTVASKDERELAAEKVTDAQLRKYWRAEEDGRLAPRIHQESLSLHEKILRHFDLSSQYGPCIGIQRLQRWKRANMLGLQPPVEVLAVLLREEDKKTSQGCGKLAYIDELAGGRVVLVE